MHRRVPTVVHAALLAAITLPSAARAQIRASQHGTVSQEVAGATFTIEYDRPTARGRDSLFGKVVRWGQTWTPGANWATTLELDRDALVEGHPLPKGKYSIWMVPERESDWTVILSRDAHRFHTRPPEAKDEQLRFTVRPQQGAHMETLAFYFPAVDGDSATLHMHWGTTYVPMRVRVPAAAGRAP